MSDKIPISKAMFAVVEEPGMSVKSFTAKAMTVPALSVHLVQETVVDTLSDRCTVGISLKFFCSG
jgi:hypothetical protein